MELCSDARNTIFRPSFLITAHLLLVLPIHSLNRFHCWFQILFSPLIYIKCYSCIYIFILFYMRILVYLYISFSYIINPIYEIFVFILYTAFILRTVYICSFTDTIFPFYLTLYGLRSWNNIVKYSENLLQVVWPVEILQSCKTNKLSPMVIQIVCINPLPAFIQNCWMYLQTVFLFFAYPLSACQRGIILSVELSGSIPLYECTCSTMGVTWLSHSMIAETENSTPRNWTRSWASSIQLPF
jgi:hypothetical protein